MPILHHCCISDGPAYRPAVFSSHFVSCFLSCVFSKSILNRRCTVALADALSYKYISVADDSGDCDKYKARQSRATITDGNECRRTFCCPHWEVCTHHTSSTRCASLVAAVAGLQENSVQGRFAGFCSGHGADVFYARLCSRI